MEAAGASSSSGAAGDGGSDGRRGGGDQLRLGLKKARRERVCTAKERISRMPPCAAGKRSSIYRGVTRHRWTGRYEAHLWDKSTWNQNQNKKGKQVYLGAYDDEEAAARAYDLAALKYWGAGTLINFPVSDYSRDIEEMQMVSKEDYLVSLRRKSSAFSRGFPKYRGVSRQPQNNRWEASQTLGNMYNLPCSLNRDATLEEKYAGGFMDRKIDLTSYIRWWIPKKSLVINAEDVDREIRSLECKKIEPYQLPSLGLPYKEKAQSCGLSALSILSRSEVFRNFQEKLAETKDETGNKEVDRGKEALMLPGGGLDTSGVSLGLSEMPVQRAPYMFAPVVSGPSRATWDPVDPPDPGYWTNFFQPT